MLKYGLYGSLAASMSPVLWLSGCTKFALGKRPNVILITLDTTRADHLGCYGYHRQTSPNIDRLAEGSVVYKKAIAPSSWTLPSHASLLTGKFTSSHGARYDPEGPLFLTDGIRGPEAWQVYRARGLAQDELTLASILKERGYVTGAVVGGPWLKKNFGLNKGFDYYDDAFINNLNGRTAKQVTSSALDWVGKLQKEKFFLFLNYFDPHNPYEPPEGFAKAFLPGGKTLSKTGSFLKRQRALYDAEILYMDHYIGHLIDNLKSWDLYNNTLFIVTADHGELLGEHGKFFHGHYLYQEELHVPLLVKYPGTEVAPNQTDVPVQLNDVFAIILERLGITKSPDIQGCAPPDIGHPVLAETYPLPGISKDGHWRAFFEEDFKFIWNSKNNHLLFHLGSDPDESINLVTNFPKKAEDLLSKMERYLARLPEPGPASPAQQLDTGTKRALKSLGYLN